MKPIELGLIAASGVGLFGICFVGFASVSGVPMHTLPVVGKFFPEPPPVEDEVAEMEDEQAATPAEELLYPDRPTQKERQDVIGASLGVIGSFAVPAPFDREELQALSDELEDRKLELSGREEVVVRRETKVEEQLLFLQERASELDTLRDTIELRAAELDVQASEIERARIDLEQEQLLASRSTAARAERKAQLFAEGEAEVAAQRLVPMGAEEAGRILRFLDPTRAREILDALPGDEWAAFAEAYTTGE